MQTGLELLPQSGGTLHDTMIVTMGLAGAVSTITPAAELPRVPHFAPCDTMAIRQNVANVEQNAVKDVQDESKTKASTDASTSEFGICFKKSLNGH